LVIKKIATTTVINMNLMQKRGQGGGVSRLREWTASQTQMKMKFNLYMRQLILLKEMSRFSFPDWNETETKMFSTHKLSLLMLP